MSKLLVDTNLLIYSIDQESKYFERTSALFNSNRYSLYTTSKNLSEFLAVTTRLPYNPLTPTKAVRTINSFRQFLMILYPSPESYQIFTELVREYNAIGLKIHDLEIASIAIANDIQRIATINKKDFEYIKEIDIHDIQ